MKSQTTQRKPGRIGLPAARDTQASTRLELAAVLAALGVLALLALPALANQRERSARVLCVNNLRLAGQAFQQWGTEHGGRMPFRTLWCEGGTQVTGSGSCPVGTALPPWFGLNNNSWYQWSWISNELRTPKILACPSDAQRRPANNWGIGPDGGFRNFNYQNHAVSYLLGLDVFPEHPDALLAGDRNVRFNVFGQTCSSGISPCPGLTRGPVGSFGIGGGLHVEAGNYLFTDGRVEELSSRAFVARWLAIYGAQDNGAAHYLVP